ALGGRETGREQAAIPFARHQRAAFARLLLGKILGIADADQARTGVATEAPRRKRNRRQERLQMARRQVDDEPPDAPGTDRGETGGDDLAMPVECEIAAPVQFVKGALGKTCEIDAQKGPIAGADQLPLAHSAGPSRVSKVAMTFSSL